MSKTSLLSCIISFLLFLFPILSGYSQGEAASKPQKSPLMEAREYMSKNKNAEALEVLQKHGKIVVPKYAREQDSIVKSISGKFAVEKKAMLNEISTKDAKVRELKSGNEDIDRENTILTTNTIIFFSVLLGVVIFILLGRVRVLKKSRDNLAYANSLLGEMEKAAMTNPGLKSKLRELQKPLTEASTQISNTSNVINTLIADKNHSYHKQAKQLVANTESMVNMVENRLNPAVDEKVQSDLNRIIEEVANQAYFGMLIRYPEFKCNVVKDLEKILPTLEVYPDDIRFVLFNLLENSFEAVWRKRSNSPKGYEPTVTISTRKLPRFVQIRVKDNGIGISDKAGKRVFEPFYTERESTLHPGLGLSESYRLIVEKHKGELYIDSDLASSTDLIIRFPTVQLM